MLNPIAVTASKLTWRVPKIVAGEHVLPASLQRRSRISRWTRYGGKIGRTPIAACELRTILEKTCQVLEMQDRSVQFNQAEDAKGEPVAWHSPEAVRFCATGALFRLAWAHVANIGVVVAVLGVDVAELLRINDREGREAAIGYLRALAPARAGRRRIKRWQYWRAPIRINVHS